jgi:uncharacterized membrane protein
LYDRAVSRRWDTGRTEAFSDGVFAIAITLLVLDLAIPQSSLGNLWHAILHDWPAYLAYVTSFMTIGSVWLAHHAIFSRLRYVDATLMRINLVLLLATSFLPFPTRLMAEAIRITASERAAVIFYGSTLLVISLLLALLARAVATRPQLRRPEVDEREVRVLVQANAPDVGFYVVALIAAIVAPRVAAFGFLVISIVLVARAHGSERDRGALDDGHPSPDPAAGR